MTLEEALLEAEDMTFDTTESFESSLTGEEVIAEYSVIITDPAKLFKDLYLEESDFKNITTTRQLLNYLDEAITDSLGEFTKGLEIY